MLMWLKDGADPATFPKTDDKDDYANLLVVGQGGVLLKYENSPTPIIYEPGQKFAMGSGRDFALMAMHLGKTAREAVELTCQLTVECGNGVDSLEFGRDSSTAFERDEIARLYPVVGQAVLSQEIA
jgi:hypothetical protein